MEPTTLTEHCHQWNQNVTVDAEHRIVRNVALAGTESKNGYKYSESSLSKAVNLYEDRPVFLDHAEHRHNPHERSTRDLVGSISNATYSNQRIKGDIRVLDTESGRTFLKLLEVESPGIGMSHVVRARKSSDGTTVEEIAEVISVDVVINPATTRTFSESVSGHQAFSPEKADVGEKLGQQFSDLQSEHNQLQQQHAQLLTLVESLQSENQVQKLLTESQLPDRAVSEFFIQQLRQAPDALTRKRMIEDRQTLLTENISQNLAVSSQPRLLTIHDSSTRDRQFISAIRRA